MSLYDVILALSYGKPSSCQANRIIASEAIKNSSHNLIIADHSVPLNDERVFFIGNDDENVHSSTIELIEEFLDLCWKMNWQRILVITADSYVNRVIRDIKKMRKNGKPEIQALNLSKYEWFYPDSTQIWTRNKFFWNLREWILMHIPFKWYVYITKKLA